MLAVLLNLGFAGGGAAAPTPTPSATTPTPAGSSSQRSNKRSPQRYYVEIDGQEFLVNDASEAQQLLQRARAIAERQAEEKSERVTKQLRKKPAVPQVRIEAPAISVSPELRADVAPLIADISRLYEKAAMEAELRLLLQKQLDDEDEDELLLLL